MRKWIIIYFYLIYSIISLLNTTIVLANSESYAKVINSTNLYKTENASDNIFNIYCIAEKSYFVKIISEHEEYYYVHYNGITGYIKKNDVKEITNTPSTPYPNNIKLTIKSPCNLRRSPNSNTDHNNIITTLSTNESNFTFIGRINSYEAIDFGGTTWYYVNYNGEYGYIYNKYVKSISPIYENSEKVSFKEEQIELINPITHTPTIIIILILFIPCIIILLILYLPRKLKKSTTNTINEIYKY